MNSPSIVSDFSGDPPACKVLDALQQGKWRHACNQAKQLYKKDATRYQSLLLQAQEALFRDAIANKLEADASAVLKEIMPMASKALLATLEAEFQALSKELAALKSQKMAEEHLPAAMSQKMWQEILAIDAAMQGGAELDAKQIAHIDDTVASFHNAPMLEGNEQSERLAKELAAVQAACCASAEGHWEEALEAIRLISARSIFRHWRIFLRGVKHFLQEEEMEAKACFQKLPSGGACAVALGVMLQDSEAEKKIRPAIQIGWKLAVSGQPENWASAIIAADTAWNAGSWQKANKHLLELGDDYPNDEHGLAAAITSEFFTPDSKAGGESYSQRFDEFINYTKEMNGRYKSNPKLFAPVFRASLRGITLLWDDSDFAFYLKHNIPKWLDLEEQRFGKNLMRDSQIWQFAAEYGAELLEDNEDFSPFSFFFSKPKRNKEPVKNAFLKATQCDPNNLEAWLGLLDLCNEKKDQKEKQSLLDDLATRFPANKEILSKAGHFALQKKMYLKAAGYYQQAFTLDPLDSELRKTLFGIACKKLKQDAKKGKVSAGSWNGVNPILDVVSTNNGCAYPQWVRLFRTAILSHALTPVAREELQALAPSKTEFFLIGGLLHIAYGFPIPSDFNKEIFAPEHITWQYLTDLTKMLFTALEKDEFLDMPVKAIESFFITSVNATMHLQLIKDHPAEFFSYLILLKKMYPLKNSPYHWILYTLLHSLYDKLENIFHNENPTNHSVYLQFVYYECQTSVFKQKRPLPTRQIWEQLLHDVHQQNVQELVPWVTACSQALEATEAEEKRKKEIEAAKRKKAKEKAAKLKAKQEAAKLKPKKKPAAKKKAYWQFDPKPTPQPKSPPAPKPKPVKKEEAKREDTTQGEFDWS